jgi:hypothetical protein
MGEGMKNFGGIPLLQCQQLIHCPDPLFFEMLEHPAGKDIIGSQPLSQGVPELRVIAAEHFFGLYKKIRITDQLIAVKISLHMLTGHKGGLRSNQKIMRDGIFHGIVSNRELMAIRS